jgi:hypothetical protein
MEGHTFLSWNIPNLITVGLMGVVLAAIIMVAKRYTASAAQ